VGQGYTSVEYDCSGGTGTNLLIWLFKNTNLEQGNDLTKDVTTQEVQCGNTVSISDKKSFKISFETPGIYYCLKQCKSDDDCTGGCGDNNMCAGYMSNVHTSSEDSIDSTFAGNITGVKIVNDGSNSVYYGAVFHNTHGLENSGKCNTPIGSITQSGECIPVGNSSNTVADDIFQINLNPISSGDGATFYSVPYGWTAGARAGFIEITGQQLADEIIANENTMPIPLDDFHYTNVDRIPSYQNRLCKTFTSCPGSIKIKGNYLVIPYSNLNPDGSGECQTFSKDVHNYIIPTK
jgi:hypothetical protein